MNLHLLRGIALFYILLCAFGAASATPSEVLSSREVQPPPTGVDTRESEENIRGGSRFRYTIHPSLPA
jgi:hypothetical protein